MKVKYQHLRGRKGNQIVPKVTVCYIRDDVKTAVGISICSEVDNFSYELGRNIAFGRAAAAYNEGLSRPINRDEAAEVLQSVYTTGLSRYRYKAIFNKAFVIDDPNYIVAVKQVIE